MKTHNQLLFMKKESKRFSFKSWLFLASMIIICQNFLKRYSRIQGPRTLHSKLQKKQLSSMHITACFHNCNNFFNRFILWSTSFTAIVFKKSLCSFVCSMYTFTKEVMCRLGYLMTIKSCMQETSSIHKDLSKKKRFTCFGFPTR